MKKKRIVIIITLCLMIVLTIATLAYLLFFRDKEVEHNVIFKLNDPINQELEYGLDYTEFGATVTVDGLDYTEDIKVDTTKMDTTKVGTYKVKYYIVLNGIEYKYYRNINIVDKTSPEITLTGSSVTILVGEEYKELGYKANDKCDGDITKDVKTTNNINKNTAGEYEVKYEVTDSSNNKGTASRKVIVKKPNKVVAVVKEENKETPKVVEETSYPNTVKKNRFTSSGFYLEGYIKNSNGTYQLKFAGDENYSFPLTKIDDNNYKGDISLNNVANGTYKLYIVSTDEEKLLNKMNYLEKIVRAKVDNKLVTFSYDNDEVSIKVEDFGYAYDILMDVGHGGSDPGAVNAYIQEKEMNLIVSKYEKCRYESMGLRVYMTRNDDTYGSGYGLSSIKQLYRRSLEIGYYGTVSKIIYSNHHNSIGNNYYSGYEIIIPGSLTNSEMQSEKSIMSKFNSIYSLSENHTRYYTRDYDSERIYSKANGETYQFKNYYAIIRIPFELFNVKSVIYEGIYLSNKNDFDWYWKKQNWIKASEAKIEVYASSLGVTYNADNSSCLS